MPNEPIKIVLLCIILSKNDVYPMPHTSVFHMLENKNRSLKFKTVYSHIFLILNWQIDNLQKRFCVFFTVYYIVFSD